jgi:hypothetical protein
MPWAVLAILNQVHLYHHTKNKKLIWFRAMSYKLKEHNRLDFL